MNCVTTERDTSHQPENNDPLTASTIDRKTKHSRERGFGLDIHGTSEDMSSSQPFPSIIDLNVGGHIYTTSLSTLTKYPHSMLGVMFSGRIPVARDSKGNFFIDRDGQTFRFILNFLRSSKLRVPSDPQDREQLIEEADFYQIEPLIDAIKASPRKFAARNPPQKAGDVVRVRLVVCPRYSNVTVSVYGAVSVLDDVFPDRGKELGGQMTRTGEATLGGRTVEGACVFFPVSYVQADVQRNMTKVNDTNATVIIVLEELVRRGFNIVSTGYRSPVNPREDEDSPQTDDQFQWICIRH